MDADGYAKLSTLKAGTLFRREGKTTFCKLDSSLVGNTLPVPIGTNFFIGIMDKKLFVTTHDLIVQVVEGADVDTFDYFV